MGSVFNVPDLPPNWTFLGPDRLPMCEVVRTLKPTRAAGTPTITWRVRALPTTAHYFWVRVSTACEDSHHTPGVTAWTAPVQTGR